MKYHVTLHWLIVSVILSACSQSDELVRLQDLQSNPNRFAASSVQIDACLLVSRHEMAIADCTDQKALFGVTFGDHGTRSPELDHIIRQAQQEWAPGADGILKARFHGTLVLDGERKTFRVSQANVMPL